MYKRLFLVFIPFFFAFVLNAQNRIITGTVISYEDNLPLPGTTVTIQNTTIGTQTDLDGKYKIEVNTPNAVLVFTFIGMKEQKITIGISNTYNVVMKPDVVGIEEVVVTVPYGVQKRETFTGSLGLLQSDDMKKQRDESIDKMLQGAVAGVNSNTGSGQPGSKSEVRIRGIGSISASSEPLYVIDGIPVSSGPNDANSSTNILATINPGDIESVSVLKDAAATSLYGSRASNGVIMITTKKGGNGKTNYSFSSQQGITTRVNSNLKVLNSSEYLSIRKEEMQNAGYGANYISAELGSDSINTNWQKEVYRYGYIQKYDFSATGGNDKTNFFMSGSYNNEKGVVINTGIRKMSARMNVTHKATENLSFGTKITLANTFQQVPHDQMTNSNEVYGSYSLAPNFAIKTNDSTYNFTNQTYNVVGINKLDEITNTTNRLLANAFLEYKINKKLTFRTINGIDYINFSQFQYVSPETPDGSSKNGLMTKGISTENTATTSNTINYSTKIKDQHSFDILGGYEVQYSKTDSTLVSTSNFPSTSIRELSNGTTVEKIKTPETDWAIISYLSNLQYNFKGKYYFSGSYRRDGSSRFSGENRWSNFWSSGFSWRITDEEFMKQFTKVNSLRFHASYGTSGNSEVGNYASRYLFEYDHNYNNSPGGYPIQIGNDKLTWEKTKSADLGLELRIFKKVAASLDLYHRTTSNLLLNVPISVTNGFEYQLQNVGAMVNKGIEFSVNTENLKTENFLWQTDFNIAMNHNEITELNQGNDIVDKSQIRRVGEAYNSFYLAEWAGVDAADGSAMWYDSNGNLTKDYAKARKIIAGNADPKFIFGLGNTFTYKRVSLSFSFYGKVGNKIYNNIDQILVSDGALTGINQSTKILDRWQKSGDITDVPKLVYSNSSNSNQPSTRYLENGSYLKLRSITLSYQVPEIIAKKAKVNGISFYIQGQNIWTWTRYSGIDPEQNTRGVSWFRYPNSRSVIGGVTITI